MHLLFLFAALSAVLKNELSKKYVQKDELLCYYQNSTSLRGKLLDFNGHFATNGYDLIAISETWLNDSVFDGELLIHSDFNVFRRDRSRQVVSDKNDGGGVLLAVKSSFQASRRYDLETNMEILWVEVLLDSKKSLFVGNCYINYPSIEYVMAFEESL